ncbi:MAG: mechanosensitive ion channel protein, partial [Betaproteobacteria bacterium]|nr:mechanosensitive ion channel protein [Betaproteobacteria bacterium]
LVVIVLWILLDIPGVKDTSLSILLFGGALLGALAFVFQGLLRDFVAGLLVLLEDRYAIGDWIEVDGVEGEVMDVGLFSTQLRCVDQRVDTLDNSGIRQLRNLTKLRSGSLVTFVISHQQPSIDAVLAVLRDQIAAFMDDPDWSHRLLSSPVLRGVRRTTPMGVQLEVLLLTHSGEQWVCEREFQLRVLRAFESHGIRLADGLELSAWRQAPKQSNGNAGFGSEASTI